jgi:hypothetical protein
MLLVGNLRTAVPRVLVALVVFFSVASPYVVALSKAKGRLTFGDSGKLTYSFWVNDIPLGIHLQDESPGRGTPLHPTRRIFDNPPVYEFGTPIGGTYPPWYDASYWHEGLVPHFDLTGQIRVLKNGAETLFQVFRSSGLVVGCLILYFVGGWKWFRVKDIARHWPLFAPSIVAFILYLLTVVLSRYLGAFVVLIWIGIFSGIRLPESQDSRRLIGCATAAMVTVMMITISFSPVLTALSKAGQLVRGRNPWPHLQYQVAEGLNRMGVRSGDKVAFIGNSFKASWARLARVKIVAEIPSRQVANFWAADNSIKSQVIKTFGTTGAKVIVVEYVPSVVSTRDWKRIGNTSYHAYMLPIDR